MAFADQLENNRRWVFVACCRMSLVFAIVYLNIFNLLLWLSVPFFLNLALIIQREESTMPSWPYMLLHFFFLLFFFLFFFSIFFFFSFSFQIFFFSFFLLTRAIERDCLRQLVFGSVWMIL